MDQYPPTLQAGFHDLAACWLLALSRPLLFVDIGLRAYCSAADLGQKSCKVRAALNQRLETSNDQLIIHTLAQ
jgi:hypothetical protein